MEYALTRGIPVSPTSPPASPAAKRVRKISATLTSGAASLARLATGFTQKLSLIPDGERTLVDSETTIASEDAGKPLGKSIVTNAKLDADALYFSNLNANDAAHPGEDRAPCPKDKTVRLPLHYTPGGVQSPPGVPAPACISPTQATRERNMGATGGIMGKSPSWAASYPAFTIDYRRRFGEGGMSESYLARITYPKARKVAGPAFVKHISKEELKRAGDFSEIRAYQRMTMVGDKALPYVAGIQAFVDHPELPYYIFISVSRLHFLVIYPQPERPRVVRLCV